MLTDSPTASEIRNNYKRLIADIADIKEIEVPQEFNTPITRSRYIKTNLRNLIDGDFLFLDTDTVVCDSLEPFTKLDCDLGMVFDFHLPMIKLHPNYAGLKNIFNSIGWQKHDKSSPYFNSGVIYCKDSQVSREFFMAWHNKWREFLQKDVVFDQISLNNINQEQQLITSLSGHLHCQIEGNGLKYFNNATIIHYYNIFGSNNKKCLFHNHLIQKSIIDDIQNNNVSTYIKEPKQAILLRGEDIDILSSNIFIVLRRVFRSKRLFYGIDNCISQFFKLKSIFR